MRVKLTRDSTIPTPSLWIFWYTDELIRNSKLWICTLNHPSLDIMGSHPRLDLSSIPEQRDLASTLLFIHEEAKKLKASS